MWFLLQFIYLIVPGAFANAAPVLVRNRFEFLNRPVDNGKTFRGRPIFGSHKTWRGIICGTLVGVGLGVIQGFLYHRYPFFRDLSIIDFDRLPGWLLGFLEGFGALSGDLVKSFFKRRVNVAPGKPFFPWDQLDCFFGALLLVYLVQPLPWWVIILGVVLIPLIHVSTNLIWYFLGLKKTKF